MEDLPVRKVTGVGGGKLEVDNEEKKGERSGRRTRPREGGREEETSIQRQTPRPEEEDSEREKEIQSIATGIADRFGVAGIADRFGVACPVPSRFS